MLYLQRLFLFILLTIFVSCEKADVVKNFYPEDGITYPGTVYFGTNILALPDSALISEGSGYEIGAILGQDANLKIVITNYPVYDSVSTMYTMWFYTTPTGWAISPYDDLKNTQQFVSSQKGIINAAFEFWALGHTGSCRIDFYENSSTITHTKYLSWH